jgi:hypothetical protein
LNAPNKVRVLSIDPSSIATVDTVLATDKLPGYEPVSSMARRSNAIAAINGDYSRPSGRPVFTFARDGRLDQDAMIVPETGRPLYGRNFSIDQSERSVFMTHPRTRYWFWVPGPEGGISHRIDRFNDRSIQSQATSQIRAFTSVGGTEERPPHRGCYVHLQARRKPQAANPTHAPLVRGTPNPLAGIERTYVVDERVCRYQRVMPNGGITLYAPKDGDHADTLRAMPLGSKVIFGWSLGWPNVFDTVGGNPTLIEDGRVQWQSIKGGGTFVADRHPRTAVAYNSRTNRLFFVTVDGRQPNYSRGMTLAQLTGFLRRRLGATDALNLDGGGSTTMVVNGKIRGRPSDGSERWVSSALVVLRGEDPDEQRGAGVQSQKSFAAAPQEELRASESGHDAMVQDPASVGGLADWLEQDGHTLPPFLEQTADDFRTTQGPTTD